MGSVNVAAPPPPYSQRDWAYAADHVFDPSPSYEDLYNESEKPTVEHALAHLKLLHAIHTLRTAVSKSDALFDCHDADVEAAGAEYRDKPWHAETLSYLRHALGEKRWAVYVTRAVHRFALWSSILQDKFGTGQLTMADLSSGRLSPLFNSKTNDKIIGSRDDLPPLDILMVWHAFMLNPRCYLEDCLRQGMVSVWQSGLPWVAIASSIDDTSGEYDPGPESVVDFEDATGIKWSNLDNEAVTVVQCTSAHCMNTLIVPFSIIDRDEIRMWAQRCFAEGKQLPFPASPVMRGYCEPAFSVQCDTCRTEVNHDTLRAAKFYSHAKGSSAGASPGELDGPKPMPGTVLDDDGCATTISGKDDPRLFPNQLVQCMMKGQTTQQLMRGSVTMEDVRRRLEVDLHSKEVTKKYYLPLNRKSRIPARNSVCRMLTRYWENSSSFTLDLVGAVIRQGHFIEKMAKIDWLHSSTPTLFMANSVVKYQRFFQLHGRHPRKLFVPTLDVDLIWQTHQLSPRSYYDYSIKKARGIFVDHSDRIAETKLHTAFAETSKIYQTLYKEPYSHCVCWYCESIRASHDPSSSNVKSKDPVARAQAILANPECQCEPGKEPHISAHNAIRPKPPVESKPRPQGSDYELELQKIRVDLADAYDAACKRAKKFGRVPPRRPDVLQAASLKRVDDTRHRAAHNAAHVHGTSHAMVIPFYAPPCDSALYPADPGAANLCGGDDLGNCVANSSNGGDSRRGSDSSVDAGCGCG